MTGLEVGGCVRVVLEGTLVSLHEGVATVNVPGGVQVRVSAVHVAPDSVAQESADYWAGESRRKAEEMQG